MKIKSAAAVFFFKRPIGCTLKPSWFYLCFVNGPAADRGERRRNVNVGGCGSVDDVRLAVRTRESRSKH